MHLSEITGDSDTEAGEIGGEPVGPKDFPGIETKFDKQTYEQRRERINHARERLRIKKLLRQKGFDATTIMMSGNNTFIEDLLGANYKT